MKCVLFDLDDTLYAEMDFVRSGFMAVSRYLRSRFDLDEQVTCAKMLDVLQRDGRGRVFDRLLEDLNLYDDDRVRLLLYVYRSHVPRLRLYEDSLPALQHLQQSGLRTGVVTDGIAAVQWRKIAALGLGDSVDAIVCSDELGRDFWKPSVIPFRLALDLTETPATEAVYVGNDPSKDFIGPNSMGMLTVQVNRPGTPVPMVDPDSHAAPRLAVSSLREVLALI